MEKTMKKNYKILLIVFTLFSATTIVGYSTQPETPNVTDLLQNIMDSIEALDTSGTQALDIHDSDIKYKLDTIDDLNDYYADGIRDRVEYLVTGQYQITTNLETIDTKIDWIQGDINEIDGEVEALQGILDYINEMIGYIQYDIGEMGSLVYDTKSIVEGTDYTVDSIQGTVDTMDGKVDSLQGTVDTILVNQDGVTKTYFERGYFTVPYQGTTQSQVYTELREIELTIWIVGSPDPTLSSVNIGARAPEGSSYYAWRPAMSIRFDDLHQTPYTIRFVAAGYEIMCLNRGIHNDYWISYTAKITYVD